MRVLSFYHSKLRGIKLYRLRIALQLIGIRVICEICGFNHMLNVNVLVNEGKENALIGWDHSVFLISSARSSGATTTILSSWPFSK